MSNYEDKYASHMSGANATVGAPMRAVHKGHLNPLI